MRAVPHDDDRRPMTTLDLSSSDATTRRTATDLVLAVALAVAPFVYLLADVLYAVNGWNTEDAGGVHVIGAVLYGVALVRFVSWTSGRLAAATLVTVVVGCAGNVAYGFNSIQVSLGATDLVDTSGAGAIIKPLGLFLPISLVLVCVVLARARCVLPAVLVGVAGVAWPVAHIGNVAWLAVTVNVLLVVGLVPLARSTAPTGKATRPVDIDA